MDVLPYNFRSFKISGMWFEDDKYIGLKLIYRSIILVLIAQFVIGEFIELFTLQGDISEFTELLYIACSFSSFYIKLLNFIIRRREMLDLLDDFRAANYQAKSQRENMILDKCRRSSKLIFTILLSSGMLTGLMLLIIPLVKRKNNQIYLPMKSYQFLDVTDDTYFWISYSTQALVLYYSILLNISMDTMVFGFVILATGQFRINYYRFRDENETTRGCLGHYLQVKATVKKIQDYFIGVIVPLFCFSLIILCTSIFELIRKPVCSFEFVMYTLYLITMLGLIFLYCFFGNELELQSKAITKAIYTSKWFERSSQERRKLWFIMLFVQNGSTISFHGQCDLSLRTFLWVVKTSYTALNLLQQA